MKPLVAILVVDDDRAIRELVCAVLADAGYGPVSEAHDGVEALLILQLSPTPMLVVCDSRMPRLNGLGLLAALTTDGPALCRHAFLLMTGNADQFTPTQRRLLQGHRVAIVHKPFDLQLLLDAVKAAVGRLQQEQAVVATTVVLGARKHPRRAPDAEVAPPAMSQPIMTKARTTREGRGRPNPASAGRSNSAVPSSGPVPPPKACETACAAACAAPAWPSRRPGRAGRARG